MSEKPDETLELHANRAYVVIQHCMEIGMSDDEIVFAAKMMLRAVES